MHCPSCGKQNSTEQRFCRFCGSGLEAISQASPEHPALPDSDKRVAKVTNRIPPRRMKRETFWGIVVAVLGVTLLTNSQGHALVDWLGILVFLAGIALAIYGALSPERARRLPSGEPSQPKALNQSEANLYLPPEDFSKPVGSVTEATTELLEIKKSRISK